MDSFEDIKKNCIGKEYKVNPNELHFFTKGRCTLTYKEKSDVLWKIKVKLIDEETMKVTNIKRESIIKVV